MVTTIVKILSALFGGAALAYFMVFFFVLSLAGFYWGEHPCRLIPAVSTPKQSMLKKTGV